jgi:hypothetical protein
MDKNNMLYKYPRTTHLNWSPGATNDDKILKSTSHFEGKHVVVTEKLDGENTTIAKGRIYARSIDSKDHPSRHWLKNTFGYLTNILKEDVRICGENVFAQHSIAYKNLDSYFYAFSVWIKDYCLNWGATKKYLHGLGITHVPVLYEGMWDEKICKSLMQESTEKGEMEGYVVRVTSGFKLENFGSNVAKFVRKNHVQTDEHWMYQPIVKNKLRMLDGQKD